MRRVCLGVLVSISMFSFLFRYFNIAFAWYFFLSCPNDRDHVAFIMTSSSEDVSYDDTRLRIKDTSYPMWKVKVFLVLILLFLMLKISLVRACHNYMNGIRIKFFDAWFSHIHDLICSRFMLCSVHYMLCYQRIQWLL